MINLFTKPELFRVIDTYTDLRSLCDTCTLLSTLKKYIFNLFNKTYELCLEAVKNNYCVFRDLPEQFKSKIQSYLDYRKALNRDS